MLSSGIPSLFHPQLPLFPPSLPFSLPPSLLPALPSLAPSCLPRRPEPRTPLCHGLCDPHPGRPLAWPAEGHPDVCVTQIRT